MTVRRPGLGFLVQWPLACWIGLELAPSRYVFTSTRFLYAVAFAAVATVSVLGHELAHAAVGRATTGQTASVRLFGPLLGGASIDDPNTGEPIDAWTIRAVAAGPVSNLIVAAISWLSLSAMPASVPIQVFDLVVLVLVINAAVGVLNLMPVEPLDGGRILTLLALRGSVRTRLVRTHFTQGLGVGLSATVFIGLLSDAIASSGGLLMVISVLSWGLITLVSTVLAILNGRRWLSGLVPTVVGLVAGWAFARAVVLFLLR